MAFSNEQHRKRYAENPEYRERKLAAGRGYREERREQLNALWREKWRSSPAFRERWRARRRRAYGLGAEEYERMMREQDGVCAICGRRSRRELCVDHCHATNKVRGLLCDRCNTALGLLGDDPDRMRAAGAYVDRARGAAAHGGRGGDVFVPGGGFGERSMRRVRAALQLRAEAGRFRVG